MQHRSNIGRLLYVLPYRWSSSDEPLYAQLAHVAERHRRAGCSGLVAIAALYLKPPLTVTPMLGAAQGAYEHFREWTKTRKAVDGASLAEKISIQVRMARAAADLDACELLLRRAAQVPHEPESHSPQLPARSVRDFARAAELAVGAIDTLIALSGTAGFATSHPIQRAWRDIHFASMHISLNTENNYAHFGRTELGFPRDPNQPFF
jgi:hypothetical protein